MVFALLCRPELLNAPYREIVDAAGVALGAVGWVYFDLQARGYVAAGKKKGTWRLQDSYVRASSRMFSVRPENPVEPLTLNVLEVVASVAADLELPWFVAGAMARDILLSSVFGLDAGRATRDVDLAVAVDSWQQFSELKQ